MPQSVRQQMAVQSEHREVLVLWKACEESRCAEQDRYPQGL